MLVGIGVGMKDNALVLAAAEAAADLPFIPRQDRQDVFTNAAILATQAHQADKAATYAHALQDLNLTDDRSKRIIARALAVGDSATVGK